MKLWHSALTAVIAAAALAAPLAAHAAWPDQPIRVIVPYTPGGGTDTVTRNLLEKITRGTGWNMIVENKPGAGGNIGMNTVAKADPDGYVIGMGQTANLAINPVVLPSMPFDAKKDFEPVAVVAEVPLVLVVRPDAPWKTLDQVIAAAKAKPGELRQAVAAMGTVGHLVGEMFASEMGARFLVVPYKGAAPALNDLIGEQTDLMFSTPQSVTQLIESGRLRALAVTSAQRLASLPDVPTVAESGKAYAGFEAVDWKAIMAPAGTPKDVVAELNKAINTALKDPGFLAQLHSEGSTPVGGSVAETQRYIAQQQDKWASLIEKAHIKF
jgi:tripartite-type tricarboxylate transporter receptor subunit TctC